MKASPECPSGTLYESDSSRRSADQGANRGAAVTADDEVTLPVADPLPAFPGGEAKPSTRTAWLAYEICQLMLGTRGPPTRTTSTGGPEGGSGSWNKTKPNPSWPPRDRLGLACEGPSPAEGDRAVGIALPVLAVVVGLLIGMVGVGGVLLPPGLAALGDLTANEATATSTWAFVFTGVVGTVAYAWRGVVPWGMLARLTVGVVPAAFLGALVNATLPAPVVLLGLAALTLFVGVQQLRRRAVRETRDGLGTAALVAVGAFVGFGSALTGTGGPVLLVPVLLTLRVAPLRAVAVSQAVQLPVVVAGSVGYLQTGLVDIRLGTALGCLAALGVVAGAVVATRIPVEGLGRIVALACITAGVFLVVRAAV